MIRTELENLLVPNNIIILPNKRILGIIAEVKKDSVILIKSADSRWFDVNNTYTVKYSNDYIYHGLSKWNFKILTKEEFVEEFI